MTEERSALQDRIACQNTISNAHIEEKSVLEQILNEEQEQWKCEVSAAHVQSSELQKLMELQHSESEAKMEELKDQAEAHALILQQTLAEKQEQCRGICSASTTHRSELQEIVALQHTEQETQAEADTDLVLHLQQSLNEEKEQFEHECVTAAAHHSELRDMIDFQRIEFEEQERKHSLIMQALQQSLHEEQEQCRCDCSAATALSSELQNRMVCQRTEFEIETEALESQKQVLQQKFNEEQERCKPSCVASTAYHSELQEASHTLFPPQLLGADQEQYKQDGLTTADHSDLHVSFLTKAPSLRLRAPAC